MFCTYKGPGSNQHVESICPFLLAWFGNSRFAQQQQPPKSSRSTMTEPDELYTLRAQFWLGHYQMAADEAKSIMRRPMSPALKAEREEFVLRSLIAMGQFDKVISSSPDTPGTYIFTSTQYSTQNAAATHISRLGLKALVLKAQYDSSSDDAQKGSIVQQIQSMLGDGADTSVQLTAAHIFLAAGMKKEALQCVHAGATLEHIATTLQIYLQIDRIDLAQGQLQLLRKKDEDSILAQLGGVHVALATGSSMAKDAVHALGQMSEQYGPSPLLLNLTACAYLQQGQYSKAEQKLEQARQEFGASDSDTLVNLIVAYQYQQKPVGPLVSVLKAQFPSHFLAKGLEVVEGAFARESMKYRV